MNIINRYTALAVFSVMILMDCGNPPPPKPKPKEIVKVPEQMDPVVRKQIAGLIGQAVQFQGKADDTIVLSRTDIVAAWYEDRDGERFWSKDKLWLPRADSMVDFIRRSEYYGLFPADYHMEDIASIFSKLKDSAAMMDAALWARGELMLTDAFASMARHLKLGRIPIDSVNIRKDTIMDLGLYIRLRDSLADNDNPGVLMLALEPVNERYRALRASLPAFLDSLDRKEYTYIDFPKKDSMVFVKQLQSRLYESQFIDFIDRAPDSTELANAIKKVQTARKLKIDGKAGPELVGSLNNTGMERWRRLAINLDRYKQLPDSLPTSYIWVNIPAFKMQVWDSGAVKLESKIIVGQPKTRTPVLNSAVTNMITFPQWTVPYSIIFKEMLPKIQKDIGYLDKENLMVVDHNDSVIDPATIDWSTLNKKKFPYLIRQRQGDDNSLGVMKFNFSNKYDVYMHDTNARSMFSRSNRALSHGCVRVQKWDSLSYYLVTKTPQPVSVDSMNAWMERQEKHYINLKQKVPVYLRYYTCEVKEDGTIQFFNDIYGVDKELINNYLGRKQKI
jgi:murein L,D-transpeptidase YcbB/YkuD